MFRLIDGYRVTFLVSEYHGLDPDSRREVDNVVRAGQKRNETVSRAEPTSDGYEPRLFNPFSHIVLASQYDPDDDIINRCIQIRSSRPDRDMPAVFEEEAASDLRSRLLGARFRYLDSDDYQTAEDNALEWLTEERGIEGRTREKLLAPVTIARMWDRLDELEPFIQEVVEQDKEAREESDDAMFVKAVRDLAHNAVGDTQVLGDGDPYSAVTLPYSEVAEEYATQADLDPDRVSNTKMGHLRNRLGLEKTHKRDGSAIQDTELGPKLRELCETFNLDWDPDKADSENTRDNIVSAKPRVKRIVKSIHDDQDGPVARPAVVGKAEAKGIKEKTTRATLERLKDEGELIQKSDNPPQYRPS
jgi:hypothetical protein